jgi:hypothetical protein
MSLRALELAVRDQLRNPSPAGLGYAASVCDITGPDGQPPPRCGELFVGVVGTDKSGTTTTCAEDEYGVTVVVSMRLGKIPFDRVGAELLAKARAGLNDVCDAIAAVMANQQYAVLAAANAIINATDGGPWDGFCEPLFSCMPSAAELVSGDWFEAGKQAASKYSGVRKRLRFGQARRIQKLGNVS